MIFIHYFGSAMLLILMFITIYDIVHSKKLEFKKFIGKCMVIIILYLMLTRTV